MVTTFIESSLEPLLSEFANYSEFSFDIESSGLNPLDSRILLTQFGFRGKKNYVVAGNVDLTRLMPFFSDKKWKKIIQNAKFDTKFVHYYYHTPTRNVFDTMLAERLISNQDDHVSASLEATALKYLDIKLNKEIRNQFIGMQTNTFTDEQLDYAALDVEVLFGIMDAQKEKLAEFDLERIAEIEFELAPIVAAMELVGVPIDVPKWRKIIALHEEQHEVSRLRMHELIFDSGNNLNEQIGMFVRDGINLNSPQKIKAAFAQIGIDIDNTNERTLALIPHPAAQELLHYRGLQKIMTSYGDSFLDKIHPFTNRIHADFQQIGTATGRFACKEPNLQQMPEEFRECVTLADYKIVVADYSQIELRILAEYSGDPKFGAAFASGEDLHKATAATMFGIPIEIVTPEQRFIAKTINFGLAYGMGVNKLRDMLNSKRPANQALTFNKVKAIMDKYKETYAGVIYWLDEAGKLAYRRGYSETMMGRKRWFNRPGRDSTNWDGEVASIKRQGANSPIQGTNADITKLAMLNIYHDLQTYGIDANMILQVHDEIGVLARKRDAENVKSIVVESMEKAAQELLVKVPVKVDAYVNDIWKKG